MIRKTNFDKDAEYECSDGVYMGRHFGWYITENTFACSKYHTGFYFSSFPGSRINYGKELTVETVSSRVDWDAVKRLLAQSLDQAIAPEVWQDDAFKVIDVVDLRVVSAPAKCEYVTLSYVWGANVPQRHVRKKVREKLSADRLSFPLLPRTVGDAIRVCSELGYRYLWVDALCISQDNPAEMLHQINAMDRIYRGATFCVVAAAGEDAQYGLPGVSLRRTWSSSHTHIQDVEFRALVESVAEVVSTCRWNSRGWTFQESLLSRRLLYFTDCGVFFHDRQTQSSDDFAAEHPQCCRVMSAREELDFLPERYKGIISDYTRRDLTYDEDILRALAGVLNALFSERNVSYGMPLDFFIEALLWKSSEREESFRPSTYDITFPTWSWASCRGKIIIDGFDGYGLIYCALVDPSLSSRIRAITPWRLDESELERYRRTRSGRALHYMRYKDIAAAYAWARGCLEKDLPDDVAFASLLRRDNTPRRWPQHYDFWAEAFGQYASTSPFTLSDVALASEKPGRLLVRAQVALFSVKCWQGLRGQMYILDEKREKVGVLQSYEKALARLDPTGESSGRFEGKVKVIAIGVDSEEERHKTRDIKTDVADELPPWDLYEEIGMVDSKHCCFLRVMVIQDVNEDKTRGERTDDRLVQRAAVGMMTLKSWTSSKPEFKTFVIE